MTRTREPSGKVYCIPGDLVGELGKPASWNPPSRRARLVDTIVPSWLAMKSAPRAAAASGAVCALVSVMVPPLSTRKRALGGPGSGGSGAGRVVRGGLPPPPPPPAAEGVADSGPVACGV